MADNKQIQIIIDEILKTEISKEQKQDLNMKKNQLLAIDQFAFTDKRKATERQKSLL